MMTLVRDCQWRFRSGAARLTHTGTAGTAKTVGTTGSAGTTGTAGSAWTAGTCRADRSRPDRGQSWLELDERDKHSGGALMGFPAEVVGVKRQVLEGGENRTGRCLSEVRA